MAKVFNRAYIGLGFPADSSLPRYALPRIKIAAGSYRVVRVPLASEGRLTKLFVKQVAGSAVPFVVQILQSKAVYGVFDQDIVLPATPAIDPELVEVCGELNGAAGSPVEINADHQGFPFINMDGSSTNNQQYLYLAVIPDAGAPDTEWEASIKIERDVA